MTGKSKWIYMVLGGLLTLAIAFGISAAFAQAPDDGDGTPDNPPAQGERGPRPGHGRHGPGGRFEEGTPPHERLADALGISVEELQAATEAAHAAALQQAVDEGLITQAEADEILANGFGRRGFGRGGHFGGAIDFEALLAEELGISVEELQAAKEAAREARLAEMVAAGVITQEEADLMLAREAVQGYIDHDALRTAQQAAYEAAVQQALDNGDITQAQADELLSNPPGFGPGGPRGHRGPGPRGGFRGAPSEAPAGDGNA